MNQDHLPYLFMMKLKTIKIKNKAKNIPFLFPELESPPSR